MAELLPFFACLVGPSGNEDVQEPFLGEPADRPGGSLLADGEPFERKPPESCDEGLRIIKEDRTRLPEMEVLQ